ncbi:tyrosine-type recombinase/integrase [Paenibacillus sp. MCAF9]|uniref:tyrosine-type recombinase/integrase n=1 Tax=Paenibacillus sp. MCAF9 TaxID=3233046 RepID=UPI003F9BCD80
MFVIKEDTSLGAVYKLIGSNNKLIQTSGAIGFVRIHEGFTYFIITTLNGYIIKVANKYLNIILRNGSFKKREQAFSALKLFYSFLDLYHINNYEKGLESNVVASLVEFLEGGYKKGNLIDLNLKTTRRNLTINIYLSVIRDFYRQMFKVNDSELHQKSTYSKYSGGGFFGHANKTNFERYDVNKRIRGDSSPPKYIKKHEYRTIIELIEQKYSIREKVIIMLSYEYGFRIGEILGLTFEDILEGRNGAHSLYLRNRLSDNPSQYAKSSMKIIRKEDYLKQVYQEENIGYQVIKIDDEMFGLLYEYIDESRDEILLNSSDKKRSNLETKGIADKVTVRKDLDRNYYVFLNKQHYTPLTQTGWNKILREIFKTVGIKVDEKVRKNNLSHRFRHGFAMYKACVENYSAEQLAKALRHSSTQTVLKYFNPDDEDKSELLRNQREYAKRMGILFD